MLRFLEYAEGLLAERYAPAAFKEAQFGWTVADAFAGARAKVHAKMSDAEFRSLVRRLFRSPVDIHTSANFATAEAVWLGVHFRQTAQGTVVAWIDRNALPRGTFPFDVGDELLAFDGEPPATLFAEAAAATGWRSTPAFEQRFAEWFAVYRADSEWDRIPEVGAPAELVMRRHQEVAPQQVSLRWLDDDVIAPAERCPFWGKTPRGWLPELGKVEWRGPATQIPAYVFTDGGDRFGYLRFSSYGLSAEARLVAVAELDEAVDRFATMGVKGLVLDQTGNGGGNFLFGFQLLSRLIAAPMQPPLQHFLITADKAIVGFGPQAGLQKMAAPFAVEDEAAAAGLMSQHPVFAGPLNFLPKTLATAKTFRAFLESLASQPAPAEGVALTPLHYQFQPTIEPQPTAAGNRFTGPMVLLIDALDISAADYVAATLADNDRATLVGVTTSGAGGDQRDVAADRVCGAGRPNPFAPCVSAEVSKLMKRFGIASLAYTITLGHRVRGDGTSVGPIENAGVAPHVPLAISAEDLRSNFAPYRARVIDVLRAARASRHDPAR